VGGATSLGSSTSLRAYPRQLGDRIDVVLRQSLRYADRERAAVDKRLVEEQVGAPGIAFEQTWLRWIRPST